MSDGLATRRHFFDSRRQNEKDILANFWGKPAKAFSGIYRKTPWKNAL
jgi:hypothetical protein